ncbi:glycosyltransferase [Microbacterium oleivorans]|uniref:glycosyltransferase n=1 Tax=Microbacterium oleivorans TaxID=273677 RepID=UPI00142F2F79|nr:glycosyltransferase [Microbacterium oleivorans]
MTFNSAKALREFWSDLDLSASLEWIVVDNASQDDSVEVAEQLGAKVIRLPENVGFGAANNRGFENSVGEYVAFVNPDVRVLPESLPTLEEAVERTQGIVSPQLLNADGSLQPNGRGYPFLAFKVLNRLQNNSSASGYRRFAEAGQEIDVAWFMGAAVAGRRDTLRDLGPWDEHFFVYYEDSDLGMRARARGIRRLVTGNVQWRHGWARDTKKPSFAAWRREIPSMVKFYARYPYLLSVMPERTAARLDREFAA